MAESDEARAEAFAIERHGAQTYGALPYHVHLAAVHTVLVEAGFTGDVLVAAWLHDVVEDTETTRDEIEQKFGERVAALVWAVTGEGKNRKERSRSAYAKIRAFPEAATLKLADRIANVEASVRSAPDKLGMYRHEWTSFSTALDGLGEDVLWTRLRAALGVSAP